MKKMVKKILLGFMIISCTIGVAGCFNSTNNDRNREVEENIELNQKRTDIETLKKWFPKLEGMESAEWEAEVLGQSDDNSVPGPSSYRACGFIILDEEQAQKYRDEYEWKVEEIQMETQYVSIEEYQDNQWYYSAEWEEKVKPGYYIGKFYLSGNVIWFDVVKQLKHIYSPNSVVPAILDHDYDSYMKYFQSLIRHQKRVKERDENGCGYATIVNNIYTMYDGREDEFEKVFGFPMYDEDGEANYNYLMVDLYANTQGVYKVDTYDDKLNLAIDVAREYIGKEDKFKAEFGCDFDGKTVSEEMINSIVNKYKDGDYAYCDIKGISTNNFDDRYLTYLEMKGLEGGAELISPEDNDVSTKQVNEYIDNGKNVNIAVENFNLYNEDGSLAHKDVDYHWMTVTDVTEDGKYVVSSWGERFIFDPSEKKPNKYAVNWMNNQ